MLFDDDRQKRDKRDNWEKQGDKHARTESLLGDRKNFGLRHRIMESYKTVTIVNLNTLFIRLWQPYA
jgi:hypothetical protein